MNIEEGLVREASPGDRTALGAVPKIWDVPREGAHRGRLLAALLGLDAGFRGKFYGDLLPEKGDGGRCVAGRLFVSAEGPYGPDQRCLEPGEGVGRTETIAAVSEVVSVMPRMSNA